MSTVMFGKGFQFMGKDKEDLCREIKSLMNKSSGFNQRVCEHLKEFDYSFIEELDTKVLKLILSLENDLIFIDSFFKATLGKVKGI